jgi:hypothetical protein
MRVYLLSTFDALHDPGTKIFGRQLLRQNADTSLRRTILSALFANCNLQPFFPGEIFTPNEIIPTRATILSHTLKNLEIPW